MKNLIYLLSLLVLLSVQPSLSQSYGEEDDSYKFYIAIPLWLYSVDSELQEGIIDAEINTSISNRWENLEPSGELELEAAKGKNFFVFKPQFTEVVMGGSADTPFGEFALDSTVKSRIMEYWVGRNLHDDGTFVTDVYFGARHLVIEVETTSAAGDVDWKNKLNDLLVGFRGAYKINRNWSLVGDFNAAGFDVLDSSSDESYSVKFGVAYERGNYYVEFAKKDFYLDYKDTPNVDEQDISYEVKGYVLTFKYKFD